MTGIHTAINALYPEKVPARLLEALERESTLSGWVCRKSIHGRGLRLHETSEPVGSYVYGGLVCKDPLTALVAYFEQKENEEGK